MNKIIGLIIALVIVVIIVIAGILFLFIPTSSETGSVPLFDDSVSDHINCNENIYNCSNFYTQKDAQVVFKLCGGIKNDSHKLDRDKDGKACEYLP